MENGGHSSSYRHEVLSSKLFVVSFKFRVEATNDRHTGVHLLHWRGLGSRSRGFIFILLCRAEPISLLCYTRDLQSSTSYLQSKLIME